MTKLATIDYGCGLAKFYGDFDADTVKRSFYQHANQCFGIRKSIMGFTLKSLEDQALPSPWCLLPDATTVLQHSGDTIVWDSRDEKIKSEWD